MAYIYNENGNIVQEKIYGREGKDKYLKTLGLVKQELKKLVC